MDTDDFNFFAQLQDTTFNTACRNSTTACDREDVFDSHQERLVSVTFRSRYVAVNRSHQFVDLAFPSRIAFQSL